MPRRFKEKTLVLTFPFYTQVSTRGSWAVDVLCLALPGPPLRRALEPGVAPSLSILSEVLVNEYKLRHVFIFPSSDHTLA